MRKTIALIATVLLVAVLSAGCGSSGGSDASSGTTAATSSGDGSSSGKGPDVAALTTAGGLDGKVSVADEPDEIEATAKDGKLDVEIDDYYFGPAFIHAPGGTTLRLTIENGGDMAHTFTIDSLKVDEELQSGAKATVEVAVPDSGAVRYYCRFHEGSGMQGAIIAS